VKQEEEQVKNPQSQPQKEGTHTKKNHPQTTPLLNRTNSTQLNSTRSIHLGADDHQLASQGVIVVVQFLVFSQQGDDDIDGRQLSCPSGTPWWRLLATHSIPAHRKARKDGNFEEDQLSAAEASANELMVFSLDNAARHRVRMLLRNHASEGQQLCGLFCVADTCE